MKSENSNLWSVLDMEISDLRNTKSVVNALGKGLSNPEEQINAEDTARVFAVVHERLELSIVKLIGIRDYMRDEMGQETEGCQNVGK